MLQLRQWVRVIIAPFSCDVLRLLMLVCDDDVPRSKVITGRLLLCRLILPLSIFYYIGRLHACSLMQQSALSSLPWGSCLLSSGILRCWNQIFLSLWIYNGPRMGGTILGFKAISVNFSVWYLMKHQVVLKQ